MGVIGTNLANYETLYPAAVPSFDLMLHRLSPPPATAQPGPSTAMPGIPQLHRCGVFGDVGDRYHPR